MKIICENCNSTFNVPDNKIPATGARAKCSKCKSVIIIPPIEKDTNNIHTSDVKANENIVPESKKCPFCKEEILADAEKCKWCKSNLNKSFEDVAKDNISKANNFFSKTTFYKQHWTRWCNGEKIIFTAILIAIFSLFLSWVNLGLMSQNGWQQNGFYLLIFFVYPTYSLIRKKELNIFIGYILSLLSTLTTVWYVGSKTVEMHNSTVNVSGFGSWLFLGSSIMLGCGFWVLGKGSKTHKSISTTIGWVQRHKFAVLFVVILLMLFPPLYNYISIKFNKPYNMVMNLSEYSTKEEIIQANKNIENLKDEKLVDAAIAHIDEIYPFFENSEDSSKEFGEKKLAIMVTKLNLSGRKLKILAPDMTYKQLSDKFGSEETKTKTPKSIRENCEKKWEDDYSMIKYCIDKQTQAKNDILSYPADNIKINCEKKWEEDYSMVKYCIEKQTKAKNSIY